MRFRCDSMYCSCNYRCDALALHTALRWQPRANSPALHCACRPAGSLPIILYLELLCVFAARSIHKRGHAVVRFCPFSSCIVSKRQKIRPCRLLWNANRKPKLRMIPFSMTLMTSKPDLKVTPLSDAEYVRNEMRHYNGMLMRTLHAVDLLLSGMHRRWRCSVAS